MAATLIDYTIATGLLLVAFAVTVSYAISFSGTAQSDVRIATLELQAQSLLDLSQRTYAFDTSISGLGLATRITQPAQPTQPQTDSLVVSSSALQLLTSKSYSSIREDFDFRIRIINTNGETDFTYGSTPPLTDVAALGKPIIYQSGTLLKQGTFAVEVW